MSQRTDCAEIAKTLADCLNLHQPPVAVSFAESIPEGIEKHKGRVPAGCRFWQDAAAEAFATSAADHELCAVGVYTHHLSHLPRSRPI